MRTLYTLVITVVFCFSLFAVYNVGYKHGKNKQVWENLHKQVEQDSIKSDDCHKRAMKMYVHGYTQGQLDIMQELSLK